MTENEYDVGRAIKMCRTAKGMSRTALAERAGITASYLSLIERNKRDPNLSTIEAITKALEVPLTILAFLSIDPDEMKSISPELAEKLAHVTLDLIKLSTEVQ